MYTSSKRLLNKQLARALDGSGLARVGTIEQREHGVITGVGLTIDAADLEEHSTSIECAHQYGYRPRAGMHPWEPTIASRRIWTCPGGPIRRSGDMASRCQDFPRFILAIRRLKLPTLRRAAGYLRMLYSCTRRPSLIDMQFISRRAAYAKDVAPTTTCIKMTGKWRSDESRTRPG